MITTLLLLIGACSLPAFTSTDLLITFTLITSVLASETRVHARGHKRTPAPTPDGRAKPVSVEGSVGGSGLNLQPFCN